MQEELHALMLEEPHTAGSTAGSRTQPPTAASAGAASGGGPAAAGSNPLGTVAEGEDSTTPSRGGSATGSDCSDPSASSPAGVSHSPSFAERQSPLTRSAPRSPLTRSAAGAPRARSAPNSPLEPLMEVHERRGKGDSAKGYWSRQCSDSSNSSNSTPSQSHREPAGGGGAAVAAPPNGQGGEAASASGWGGKGEPRPPVQSTVDPQAALAAAMALLTGDDSDSDTAAPPPDPSAEVLGARGSGLSVLQLAGAIAAPPPAPAPAPAPARPIEAHRRAPKLTICRLCEIELPTSDLAFHLVHCTAAHSCHDRIRRLDRALLQFSSRIRRRHGRMRAVFNRIEASLQPLETISAFCEAATTPFVPPQGASAKADADDAKEEGEEGGDGRQGSDDGSSSAGSRIKTTSRALQAEDKQAGGATDGKKDDVHVVDPIQQTYHLMNVQQMAEARFKAISDGNLSELAAQASRLVSSKMDAYWDLLSLQDPTAPRSTSKRPKTYSISIKEYALVEPLGTGGFGTVWLARRRRTGDLTAIKVLSQEDMSSRQMTSAVHLEKDILALADHPFVVKLLFSFSTVRHMYIVMEYLPGGDTLTLLQSYGFLEEPLARWFVAEAVLGLQYLHNHSIIHRDIKPSNLLITQWGHVKLADFGLSAAEHSSESAAADGAAAKPSGGAAVVGTPDYLAPELLERANYGYEVDLWALGVVLYQFLVGEPPFYMDSQQDTYRKILAVDYYEPCAPDDMSAEAVALIKQLLVRDPRMRLGGGEAGVGALVNHDFFVPLDLTADPPLWERPSPFKPTIRNETDTSNFNVNELARVNADRMRKQLETDYSGDEKGDDSFIYDDSFKTINANNLARMQLGSEAGV